MTRTAQPAMSADRDFTDVLAMPAQPGARARLLVTACADEPGSVFEGRPVAGDPAEALYDGDVLLDIRRPGQSDCPPGSDAVISLMCCGNLRLVGTSNGLGHGWPERIRPVVATVMKLYAAIEMADGEIYLQPPDTWPRETAGPRPGPLSAAVGPRESAAGSLAPLLEAGMLRAGETLTWRRRNKGVRHTVTVLSGGAVQGTDGRIYPTVSAAARRFGGPGANGWTTWRRSDGTVLNDLRSQLLPRYPHLQPVARRRQSACGPP